MSVLSDSPRLGSSNSFVERGATTQGESSPSAMRRAAAYGKNFVLVVLGIQLVVATQLPSFVASTELDPSWQAGLSKLCSRNAQAGVDYVFTYGPLCYLETRAFIPELFWHQYPLKLVLGAAGALVVLLLARQMRPLWAGYAFVLLASLLPIVAEGCNETAILGSGLLLRHKSRWQLPGLVLAAALFAALSLMKQTYFYLSVPVLVALTLVIWFQGQRWRAIAPLLLFTVYFLVGWILLGQRLENLPAYFRSMAEIVGGYTEGMSIIGPRRELNLALGIVLLYVGAVATCGFKAIVRPQVFSGLAMLALGLFVSWKHAFVRQDLHVLYFFDSAMLLGFLLPLVTRSEQRLALRRALVGFAFGLTVFGFYEATRALPIVRPSLGRFAGQIRSQGEQILHPASNYTDLMTQWTQKQRECDLPIIRARVKDRTVDLIGCDQGVLFLNNLNWNPRPIFQGYSAYTPRLIEMNAEHFRGDSAPDYVLWNPTPIDGRMPTQEDSAAMFEILYRYRPVLAERSWLLLERAPANEASRPSGTIVLEKLIKPGETISLEQVPGRYQTVAIEIDPSPWGRIRSTAYRPTFVRIKLGLANQSERVYRLIPAMARNEFLLNPLCEDTFDFIKIYQDEPGKRVVSLALDTHNHDAAFAPKMKLTIREYPLLVTRKMSNAEASQLNDSVNRGRYPMFKSLPYKIQSPGVSPEVEDGKQVLVAHPEGEIIYQLNNKHRKIIGKFGIRRAAYETESASDGVLFVIEHIASDGKRTPLFQRELDPKACPGDRGEQSFEVVLSEHAEGTAILRTTNSPGHHSAWDWAYWTELELQE